MIFYTVKEYDEVKEQVYRLTQKVHALESLRPVWAMGNTTADVTRSIQANALASVWEFIGAKDQTQCMQYLRAHYPAHLTT